MSVHKPKARPNYVYSFVLQGHRFSGSTGTSNKRLAEKFEDQLRALKQKELDERSTFTAGGPMSLEIACSRYWLESGQHLANKRDCYRYLGWLVAYIGKHTTIDKITDSMVAMMVATRRGEGASNATVNRSCIGPLRAVVRRAQKVWKIPVCDVNWGQHWLKEAQERVREASRDEEQQMVSAMRADYVPALRFAFLTGCRRMEIVDLTWSRIDFFGKTITITGKGDKTRVLPMTEALRDLLWLERGHNERSVFTYVVRSSRKHLGLIRGERRPITKEGYKTTWTRYRKLSGVENFRFHDTRHTAATRILRTSNLKVVQQLLGHEDITTTAKYAHSIIDDMRAAMEAATYTPTHTPAKTVKAK